MSFASEVSRSTHSNIVNLRKNEEGLNQVDVNVQQFIDQTIAEEVEVEKAPSITYSRSISDIEEYESVLFEIESDKSWGDDYTVYCRSDDSDSEFSIPRAEKISSNISDGQRCQKDGDANLEDTTDAGLNQNIKPRNNDQHENANSSENKMNGKDVDCYEFQTGGNRDGEIDEFVKCVVNRIAQDLVMDELRKGIQKGQIKSCLQSEINEVNDEKHEKGNEEKQQGIYLNRVETNLSEKKLSGIESHDLKTKSKEETAAPHDEPQVLLSKINAPFVTKEIDDRKMRKKLLKKKERMKLFSGSNRNKNLNKKRRLCCPDPEIPSYKAKLNKEREKQETVDSVLMHLLERSFNKLEDKRIKKETIERFNMVSIIVNDIFNEAEEKADKRELEKECQNIVHGILDDIFDTWESKVNADHLIQYEKELETLCSNVVHGTLIISIRDAFGTSGYHDLHKTPKFKKIEYTNEKKERKRTLMSRNQRQNLVESRRKSTLHEETEREKNSKIEMNNQGQNERRESDRKTTEIEEKQVEKNLMGGGDIALVNDRERCIEAIYIDAEDGMSCGLSTVATLTREKPVIYHKEETDNRQADEILLEKKEDETEDSSIGILSQLPPADKDDYCFQWIMNYGKIPRPPLRNYAKDNDGRKKRFIRRANMKCERKLNRPDMEYVNPGKRLALLKHDLSSFESGQSLVESGRESQMSMRSNATLSSRESYRIKVFEEPISKDTIENIRDYFNNDARNRIKARDKAYKEKEEEEEDIRNKKIKDWEDELIHCSTEDSKDKLLEETDAALIDSSEIDSKENYDANLNETEACNLIQKDESEVESILPLESESVEDEEGERFQTPESELEIQPVDETRDIPICEEKMQEPKRKWVWPRGSLIRWKNIEQGTIQCKKLYEI